MLFRAIALSIALLVGLGTIVPLATNTIEAGPRKSKIYKRHKKHRKYTKRWWQQYRARQRDRQSLIARKRAMRLHQLRLAKAAGEKNGAAAKAAVPATNYSAAVLPSGEPAPDGWRKGPSAPGEMQFSVDNGNASAAISVVGPAMAESSTNGRARTVGGVPVTSLRREVINRMIRENGWVVNDFQKEVGDRQVYVVVAQSQSTGGRVQSRMFYFTEVDGRIYSVATNSSPDAATRLAEESEKVIFSLGARPRPTQQASVRE